MGYFTDFEIIIDAIDDARKTEIDEYIQCKAVKERNGFLWMSNYAAGEWSGNLKWYNWGEIIGIISKEFPDVTIYVNGQGENPQDIWRAIFKNGEGKISRAKIVFEDYQPI